MDMARVRTWVDTRLRERGRLDAVHIVVLPMQNKKIEVYLVESILSPCRRQINFSHLAVDAQEKRSAEINK
jgi:hypothetical protein